MSSSLRRVARTETRRPSKRSGKRGPINFQLRSGRNSALLFPTVTRRCTWHTIGSAPASSWGPPIGAREGALSLSHAHLPFTNDDPPRPAGKRATAWLRRVNLAVCSLDIVTHCTPCLGWKRVSRNNYSRRVIKATKQKNDNRPL